MVSKAASHIQPVKTQPVKTQPVKTQPVKTQHPENQSRGKLDFVFLGCWGGGMLDPSLASSVLTAGIFQSSTLS